MAVWTDLVQFVLKVDERLVVRVFEIHAAKHRAHHERTRHVLHRRLFGGELGVGGGRGGGLWGGVAGAKCGESRMVALGRSKSPPT